MNGIFTISLDFELYWGMKDVISVKGYQENLDGTPKAVEDLLDIFNTYDIHTTWSTVGFLFFNNIKELKNNYPPQIPKYKDRNINLYKYLEENEDLIEAYHFAPKLIDLIKESKNQEISTHTFSHYYTLEEDQDIDTFYQDLKSAKKIAKSKDIETNSIIFPRNQYNDATLATVKKANILSYRGNEDGWIYKATDEKDKKTLLKRTLRILDSYINISGHHCYDIYTIFTSKPYNIPASRFLRPYSKTLAPFDSLKLKRIKESMTYAALNTKLYHLWWHPHNFGKNTEKNIEFLQQILDHYKYLNKKYNFKSLTMNEISKQIY